jgi:hypothetical protein
MIVIYFVYDHIDQAECPSAGRDPVPARHWSRGVAARALGDLVEGLEVGGRRAPPGVGGPARHHLSVDAP